MNNSCLRRRMSEVMVNDRRAHTETLRTVLESDIMVLLKNYMEIEDVEVEITMDADDKVHINIHCVSDGLFDTGKLAD